MADEAAPAAAVVVAPLIERIRYGRIGDLTSVGVIQKINEIISHNKQIKLEMAFTDRCDATVAMQNTIVENSRHIKKIVMYNFCDKKGEHRKCFTFFTTIVQGLFGKGMHLTYINTDNHGFEFELEQANQLADALLRSYNNNNGAIDSFLCYGCNLTPVTIQPVLDALLYSGVRKVIFDTLDPPIDYNNIVDFTGMMTNKALEELDLTGYHMREEDYRNLFISIKVNKGLVRLKLNDTAYEDLSEELKRLFQEMMCENITLLHFKFDMVILNGDEQDRILEMIQFHMKVNRMWKRYLMQREREKKNRTVTTRIEEGDNNNNNNEEKEEEERKKRLKMRLWLHLFMKKPVLRDTILFHLLREYPDDLVSNNKKNLLRISNSNLAKKNNRKRTNDDGENTNNDGTDDPDDNDGSIDICESGSDDGTDGTL